MRCIALAEELVSRGVDCVFVADFASVDWAAEQVTSRGLGLLQAPGGPAQWAGALDGVHPDAVVVDSYEAPPSFGAALRAAGTAVLAIVDHDLRGLPADLYLDQNLGAEHHHASRPEPVLSGVRFALIRDEVLRHRPVVAPAARDTATPRVLAYFGGTDAFGAGPVVASALALTGVGLAATFVAPRPELREAIERVAWQPGQRVEVVGPPPSLMALAAQADLVVSASGTSLAELACIGSAAAVTPVVDNQLEGYALAVEGGLVAGLGRLDDIRRDPETAVAALRDVLRDGVRRQRLRERGWALVDGEGRRRVADALLALTTRAAT